MTALKLAASAAILTAPMLFMGTPADASTARQYAFQGQGVYLTSKGSPQNMMASDYTVPSPGDAGGRGRPEVRDLEHHGRYFGGE